MCTFVSGYADGTVRLFSHDYLHIKNPKFHLMSVFKAHSKPVTGFFYNNESTFFISTSEDKTLFIFRTSCTKVNDRVMNAKDLKISPIGFVKMNSMIADIVVLDNTTKDSISLIVLYNNGETENLVIDLVDWTSDDSYEISKDRIISTHTLLLDIEDVDPSFAEVAKSMERLNMKVVPKLKITRASPVSHFFKIDSDFSLVSIVNSDNETEVRLIQLSSRDSSM